MSKLKTKNKYEGCPKELEEVNWSKVPVDTLVEVSDDGTHWTKRYFKKYYPGTDWSYEVFLGGRTSKTTKTTDDVYYYEFCRIVEDK